MTLYKIVLLLSFTTCNFAFAKTNMSLYEGRAASYLLSKSMTGYESIQSIVSSNPNEVCYPKNNVACIEFVAGSYPTNDQKLAAARACVGNYGVDCAQFVAGSYPTFEQRIAAASACRDNLGMACAEFVAGSYPTSDQRTTAAKVCTSADVDCVKSVAGNYSTFDQRVAAAKACSGQ